jgi:hypothetical protein
MLLAIARAHRSMRGSDHLYCNLLTAAADQSCRALRAHNDSPQIIHGGAEMAVNGPGDYQLNQ